MLKKVISYTDYDGNERTETFFFNLNQAEVTEMELSVEGGLARFIENVVEEQDGPRLVKLFKDLILKAYGEKSPDGRRFIKSDELRESFSQTEAYSILFMELATNAEQATVFFNGIIPQDLE
jgi:hypothetical protein